MDRGKSKYVFTVNASYPVIEDAIQTYLKKEKFDLQNEDGMYYYFHFDGVWGNRFFEYSIDGYQVTIYAYIGKYKRPKAIDEGTQSQTKQAYQKSLDVLFKRLQILNETGGDMEKLKNYSYGMELGSFGVKQDSGTGYPSGVMTVGTTIKSPEDVDKENGNKAIIGFILAVVGLVLPCVGMQFGWIVIVLEFTFAATGFKSSKKGFAIATFVLASIQLIVQILVMILGLVGAFQEL